MTPEEKAVIDADIERRVAATPPMPDELKRRIADLLAPTHPTKKAS